MCLEDVAELRCVTTGPQVFAERVAMIKARSHDMPVTCFKTSIWDESLYKVRHRALGPASKCVGFTPATGLVCHCPRFDPEHAASASKPGGIPAYP